MESVRSGRATEREKNGSIDISSTEPFVLLAKSA